MGDFLDAAKKTREYLDYLETHYRCVQEAVDIVSQSMLLSVNSSLLQLLRKEVEQHDMSKFSEAEFVQYRRKFFPTDADKLVPEEVKSGFDSAWEHHKENNPHHFERRMFETNGVMGEVNGMHMICDWVAMSLAKGEKSPRKYFESKREEMKLPQWLEACVYTVCNYMES